VALAIFGIAPADSGRIEIDGVEVQIRSPRDAQKLGIGYVSEDRRKLGIAMEETVVRNITLATLNKYAGPLGILDRQAEFADAANWRDALNIKTEDLDSPVGKLSGGNQQKVMLAKWLNASPRILIVDEPTRGIDIQAKAEVHAILRKLAGQGVAIVIISSDLPEVLSIADRVLVMREGRLVASFPGDEVTEESVMRRAVGGVGGEAA
ncbi:MAG: ATP-binding cassette domain-containing protein, partial [Silicimonas sp.]|nr:ATP-binding cassette domain-containing protein [Silicimonas sp.]